ncbi:hypothetical protein Tco_0938971 [Tanacetum coccineum]|uniref:Uncharacterized protein n=1 Tax=Tanacetum coccineum TaxID=301880 RepID=A0ABQ5DLF7_9ASTR
MVRCKVLVKGAAYQGGDKVQLGVQFCLSSGDKVLKVASKVVSHGNEKRKVADDRRCLLVFPSGVAFRDSMVVGISVEGWGSVVVAFGGGGVVSVVVVVTGGEDGVR